MSGRKGIPRPAKKKSLPKAPRTPAKRAPTSPTSPTSPVLLSPIDWSTSPSYARDAQDLMNLSQDADRICRVGDVSDLNPIYISMGFRDPNVSLWFVRDARSRIFGFAQTTIQDDVLNVRLICSKRRKGGEGKQLFANILSYAKSNRLQVTLEAINKKVAGIYVDVALAAGFVARPDVSMQMEVRAFIELQGESIPLRFALPGVVRRGSPPRAGANLTAKQMKRALRVAASDSSDEED